MSDLAIAHLRYTINFIMVNTPSLIGVEKRGCGIEFINQGDSIAVINGLELYPQKSWHYYGNFGEMDASQYNVSFKNTTGNNNQLIVIRKTYQ